MKSKALILISLALLFSLKALSGQSIQGSEEYLKGVKSLNSGEYSNAIAHCEKGIEELGTLYLSQNGIVDDTGLKLALAKSEKEKGNLKVAANLYCRMLESRITLLKEKMKIKALYLFL